MFEVFSQSQAFFPISLVFDEYLVDLCHFYTTFDLFDLQVALIKLSSLLTYGTLITVDELLRLSVLLLVIGQWSIH